MNRPIRRPLGVLSLAALLALAPAVTPASASQPAPAQTAVTQPAATKLENSAWVVTLLEGRAPLSGTPVAGSRLCAAAGVMDQEGQFLAALATAASLRLEGETLELRRADGAIAVSLRAAAAP